MEVSDVGIVVAILGVVLCVVVAYLVWITIATWPLFLLPLINLGY